MIMAWKTESLQTPEMSSYPLFVTLSIINRAMLIGDVPHTHLPLPTFLLNYPNDRKFPKYRNVNASFSKHMGQFPHHVFQKDDGHLM